MTALAAAFLVGSATVASNASVRPVHVAVAAALPAADLGDGGTGSAAGAAPAATVDTTPATADATRSELHALAAAEAPTTDADAKMWSAGDDVAVRAAKPAASRAAQSADAGDIGRFARGIVNRTSSIALSLTRDAMRFIGTPYVFGGTSTTGFDCSGYVQHVFGMLGIPLPRTADAQYYAGRPARGGVAFGDLVFFQTYEPGPSHVGIYIGAGRFIHSSSHGVMVSRLTDGYWAPRYLGAKRYDDRLASR